MRNKILFLLMVLFLAFSCSEDEPEEPDVTENSFGLAPLHSEITPIACGPVNVDFETAVLWYNSFTPTLSVDFGDGGEIMNLGRSSPFEFSHEYNLPGEYQIRLFDMNSKVVLDTTLNLKSGYFKPVFKSRVGFDYGISSLEIRKDLIGDSFIESIKWQKGEELVTVFSIEDFNVRQSYFSILELLWEVNFQAVFVEYNCTNGYQTTPDTLTSKDQWIYPLERGNQINELLLTGGVSWDTIAIQTSNEVLIKWRDNNGNKTIDDDEIIEGSRNIRLDQLNEDYLYFLYGGQISGIASKNVFMYLNEYLENDTIFNFAMNFQ